MREGRTYRKREGMKEHKFIRKVIGGGVVRGREGRSTESALNNILANLFDNI